MRPPRGLHPLRDDTLHGEAPHRYEPVAEDVSAVLEDGEGVHSFSKGEQRDVGDERSSHWEGQPRYRGRRSKGSHKHKEHGAAAANGDHESAGKLNSPLPLPPPQGLLPPRMIPCNTHEYRCKPA